jgi:hypothetical protein
MSRRSPTLIDRRSVLKAVSVAGGAVVASTVASRALAQAPVGSPGAPPVPSAGLEGPSAVPPGPEVLALFGPLRPGSPIGACRLVAIHGVRMGTISVVLATSQGERFQVDVLRRDTAPGAPLGVGNTPSLSVFVHNRGSGSTATDEEHGLGAMALAAALAQREAEGAVVPALLTQRQRAARFPMAVFEVPV